MLDRSPLDKMKPISRRRAILAALSPLLLLGILVLVIGLVGNSWPNWTFVIPLLATIAGWPPPRPGTPAPTAPEGREGAPQPQRERPRPPLGDTHAERRPYGHACCRLCGAHTEYPVSFDDRAAAPVNRAKAAQARMATLKFRLTDTPSRMNTGWGCRSYSRTAVTIGPP